MKQFSCSFLSFVPLPFTIPLSVSPDNVDVHRQDSPSPLHSIKELPPPPLPPHLHPPPPPPPPPIPPALFKGLYAIGFNRPSKIQERALPLLLADPPQNFIAQSQSGTGKTAAFVLAMLSRVDPTKAHPQVTWRGLHY